MKYKLCIECGYRGFHHANCPERPDDDLEDIEIEVTSDVEDNFDQQNFIP